MLPYRLSLLCVFVPLFSVHLTWLLATLSGNLVFCVPYAADCHSISATGRYYPETLVFKGLFIPLAVVMGGYWLLLHRWLVLVTARHVNPLLITLLGCFACVALVIYTVTLGVDEGPYALARRIGAVVYFAFTSFAHLLLLNTLRHVDIRKHGVSQERHALTWTCIMLVIAAVISALLGFLWEGWRAWQNAFEWGYAVVMVSLFWWVGCMWKKTQYTIDFNLGHKPLSRGQIDGSREP